LNSREGSTPGFRAIGVIAKVFGIKGEVKVHSYSRSIEQFEELDSVFVGRDDQKTARRKIERVVPRGDEIYVKFEGVDDRNASELLVGQFLFVEESRRKRLSSGEYFVDDIVGLLVLDETEKKLGVVKEVLHYPAHDVYVVKVGRNDVMVPAVREIIREVDLKKRTVTIAPPEGLFEGS